MATNHYPVGTLVRCQKCGAQTTIVREDRVATHTEPWGLQHWCPASRHRAWRYGVHVLAQPRG